MTNADGSNSRIKATLIGGSEGSGKPLGSVPKRDWIVSTGKANKATASDASPIATIDPGKRGVSQRRMPMMPIAPRPIASA